jgi:hypothetical protein
LIVDSNSEGAQFAPTITASVKAASTYFNVEFKLIVRSAYDALRSEGAQTVPTISSIELYGPTSKLIVICNWIKFSLIFQEDCTIFCEGEWLATTSRTRNGFTYLIDKMLKLIELNPAFGHNLASGPASGHNLASGLAFGHNSIIKLIGPIGLVGLIDLIN